MKVRSPNIFGKLTGVITTLYLISSASIILAGSGALINQFFDIPKIIGSILMLLFASFFLLRGDVYTRQMLLIVLLETLSLIIYKIQ